MTEPLHDLIPPSAPSPKAASPPQSTAKESKASRAAESAEEEIARYVQMGAEAVDKLIAETQAQIGANLKKILGIETGGKPRKSRLERSNQ